MISLIVSFVSLAAKTAHVFALTMLGIIIFATESRVLST